MSAITTHILDTSRGRPAAGVPVTLEIESAGGWQLLGKGTTNTDGRIADLMAGDQPLASGVYRLIFDTGSYFTGQGIASFYPEVAVTFRIENADQHYHIPLLLNPFGYSTYRGS
jgi:5-hydroxyisourate hydrolase